MCRTCTFLQLASRHFTFNMASGTHAFLYPRSRATVPVCLSVSTMAEAHYNCDCQSYVCNVNAGLACTAHTHSARHSDTLVYVSPVCFRCPTDKLQFIRLHCNVNKRIWTLFINGLYSFLFIYFHVTATAYFTVGYLCRLLGQFGSC